MKYTLALLIVLVGAIHIDAVYYNAFDEANSEYIILANRGSSAISIEGWTLATPSSETDATLTGTLQSQSTYLIADTGWNTSRDNMSWPQADHLETLTLPNTNGYVQLRNHTTILDSVGWGETDVFAETPHPGVQEGEVLQRITSTNNNAEDFVAQQPQFTTQLGQGTVLNITVENTPPVLLNFFIEDDSPESQEVHVRPIPEGTRYINATLNIHDANGVSELDVRINNITLPTNSTGTNATYHASLPITTNTDELRITIQDANHTHTISVPVHFLNITGLNIPEQLSLHTVPGETTTLDIPLRNTGTQPLNIHIRATLPTWSEQTLGELSYTLAGENHSLTDTYTIHELGLEAGEELLLTLHIKAGFVPAREYLGRLIIAGVPV